MLPRGALVLQRGGLLEGLFLHDVILLVALAPVSLRLGGLAGPVLEREVLVLRRGRVPPLLPLLLLLILLLLLRLLLLAGPDALPVAGLA